MVLTALVTLIIGVLGIAPAQAAVDTNPNAQTWKVLVGNQTSDMAIQGMRFLPGEIWIHQTDSINFVSNSAEIHTVSYGTPPLPPTSIANLEADAFTPVGGPVFDPTAPWTNSGILAPPVPHAPFIQSYQLKFAAPGDFTFYCLIHGRMMNIVVHVLHKNVALLHDQAYYDAVGAVEGAKVLADGLALEARTLAKSSPTHVFVGAMDDQAMVMRFMPSPDVVRAGTTVTFDMSANQGVVPHTVTFTDLKQGGKLVDSGTLLPAFVGGPSTFNVTFNQTGIFHYLCEFHDDMGMVGQVIVTP
ncbi:plastocyanin/azurin family copper-binding protein [Sinomonas sp. ASV486]|nr:plastocyanin/azurin family copper-binding protein [Sinomonas sp. ASV486]